LLYCYASYLGQWNDFVAIFLKDERVISNYKVRIIDSFSDFNIGEKIGIEDYLNYSRNPQDQPKLFEIDHVISNHTITISQLNDNLAQLTEQHQLVVNSKPWKANLFALKILNLFKRIRNRLNRSFRSE